MPTHVSTMKCFIFILNPRLKMHGNTFTKAVPDTAGKSGLLGRCARARGGMEQRLKRKHCNGSGNLHCRVNWERSWRGVRRGDGPAGIEGAERAVLVMRRRLLLERRVARL